MAIIKNPTTSINSQKLKQIIDKSVTSITENDLIDVKIIGKEAFSYCYDLTDIIIPEGVSGIKNYAFRNCSDLQNIIIPNSILDIDENAFDGCSNLTYTTYNNAKYLGNSTNPYLVLASGTGSSFSGSITIHEDTKIILPYAFNGYTGLTNISIPSSIKYIGREAFRNCSNLTYTTYNNAKYLGNSTNPYLVLAKAINTSISTINISSDTKIILYGAFNGCRSLTDVTLPNNIITVCYAAFNSCDGITNLSLSNSIELIDASSFNSCKNITNLTIPSTVKKIKENAISNCINLTNITINADTPPILERSVFNNTNDCPIYVPAESVSAYQSAPQWIEYASRIQAIPE